MTIVSHNPSGLFPPYRCYSHATGIRGDARLLIISGLNGYLADGVTLPESFEEQGELICGGDGLSGPGVVALLPDGPE